MMMMMVMIMVMVVMVVMMMMIMVIIMILVMMMVTVVMIPIKDLNATQQAFKARIAECEQAEMNLKSKLTMTLKEIKVLDFRFFNVTLRLLVFKDIRT